MTSSPVMNRHAASLIKFYIYLLASGMISSQCIHVPNVYAQVLFLEKQICLIVRSLCCQLPQSQQLVLYWLSANQALLVHAMVYLCLDYYNMICVALPLMVRSVSCFEQYYTCFENIALVAYLFLDLIQVFGYYLSWPGTYKREEPSFLV